MPVLDRNRFFSGYPLDVWTHEKQDERHQQQMADIAASTHLASGDDTFFRTLPKTVPFLVINEECGSSTQGLGVLTKVAATAGDQLQVRVFERSEAPDLMERFLKHGQYESVPVFVALTDDFEEAAVMFEHPPALDTLVDDHRRAFYGRVGLPPETQLGAQPLEVQKAWVADYRVFRDQNQQWINQQVVDEIRRLVQAALHR
jgi:hypothetical protein